VSQCQSGQGRGNTFAEAWLKADAELDRRSDTRLKALVLAKYARDSKPLAYNNTQNTAIGLSPSTRVGAHSKLTLSVALSFPPAVETLWVTKHIGSDTRLSADPLRQAPTTNENAPFV
jgi:hypothetical protein